VAASLRFFVPPHRDPRSPGRAGAPPGSALATGLRTRVAILIAAATGWRGSGGNVAASLRFFVPPHRVPRSPERAGAPPGSALGTGLRTRAAILIAAALVAAGGAVASAHVGTSNAYFDGAAGPYGVRVIVRTPGVIPGLAQVTVRILGGEGVERVTVRPLRSDVGLEGAPPPDAARPVRGEAGLYGGELWLMTAGSYSVEVGVAGAAGKGTVFVPVLALAERRLDMDHAFGLGLAAAALFLFAGALTILGAAVRESVLEPGREPDAWRRRRGRLAMIVFSVVLGAVLGGGWRWWDAVDAAYRSRIYRPWSTTAAVTAGGGRQMLTLAIDDSRWDASQGQPGAALLPDHGKLMHMFLVRAEDLSAFAHVHPVRDGNGDASFTAPLPPLPAGEYRIYADIVHENGFAPTLVNTVQVPAPGPGAGGSSPAGASAGGSPGVGGSGAAGRSPAAGRSAPSAAGGVSEAPTGGPVPDPDDSWATLRPYGASASASYPLPGGRTIRWERSGPIGVDEEATLRFSVTEPDGTPSALEPYMGMLGHAAVLRGDGSLFVHLHPAGSINLTAQRRFAEAEGGAEAAGGAPDAEHGGHSPSGPANRVTFPFVFPEPGAYRIVVQVKPGAAVETAAFDVVVEEAPSS